MRKGKKLAFISEINLILFFRVEPVFSLNASRKQIDEWLIDTLNRNKPCLTVISGTKVGDR